MIGGAGSLRDAARHIVRDLLGRANQDAQVWTSLARFLPLLAEAAPDEFLTAVETGLAGEHPRILALFEEEPSPLFGSSEHTGLLWALETVAWSPEHLSRATLLLAKLARLDPGGKLANRPHATLRGVFLPWFPQTAASVEERLRVLDRVRDREPNIAWTLLRQLLPEFHSVGHPTAKPRWREWAPDGDPRVTRRELYTVYKEVFERMLADVGVSGSRWEDLIEALGVLPPEQHQQIVERLSAIDPAALPPADLRQVWEALRKFLSHHRSFPDAEWALPANRVEPLAVLYERFTPVDLLDQYAWLFSGHPALPEGREQDWEAREQVLAAKRAAAIADLYTTRGMEGISGLIPLVEEPLWLGITLGRSGDGAGEEDRLFQEHLAVPAPFGEFARGLVIGRHDRNGIAWVQEKLRRQGAAWSATQRGAFLAALPNDAATWDLVDATDADTQQAYWHAMRPWGIRPEDAERVVRGLLVHARPYSAINVLSMRRGQPRSQTLIVEALELATQTDPATDRPMQSLSFHIAELLNSLTPDADVDANRVARLEWAFLSLLHFDRSPKLLHEELARNPAFFADIVGFVFRAAGEEPHDVTPEEQQRAMHGHELLRSWRSLPGRGDAGTIDADALSTWVREARERVQANRRGRVGDQVIGEMLSGSPPGTDGAWPAEPVRDIIETTASEHLEQGLAIGVHNSRGVIHKNPAEGGEQERQLAKKYEKYAELVRDRWPRTAALLRGIADDYRAQARREDDQSELMGRLDA